MSGLFGGGKDTHTSDQQLGGLRIQTSSQGLPVTIVYGKTRVIPNLGWYGDFTAIPHTSTTSSGGKGGGGGGSVSNTTYTYTAGVIYLVCEGPITGYGNVWKDKAVVSTSQMNLTEFLGTYTQTAWPYLVSRHPSEALAYRGQAYLASGALDLGSNDILPNTSVEVNGFLYDSCIYDTTPPQVFYDILSGSNYGADFPVTQFGNLNDCLIYCQAENIVISPSYSSQRSASDIATELALIANSAIVWSEGQLKLIPYADANVSGNWLGCYNSYSGHIIAAGFDGSMIISGDGGVTWKSSSSATGGFFMAVGGDTIIFPNDVGPAPSDIEYSTDFGVTWTNGSLPIDGNWLGAAYNGTVFCSVGNNVGIGKCLTSTDGVHWVAHDFPTVAPAYCVVACGSVLVASLNGAYSDYVTRSVNNGVTWSSPIQVSGDSSSFWPDMVSNGTLIYAINHGGTDQTVGCAVSHDAGASWIVHPIPLQLFNDGPSNSIYYDGMFYTPDANNPYVFRTTDGTSFQQITLPDQPGFVGVATDQRILIFGINGGFCLASTDGSTWTEFTVPSTSGYIASSAYIP